MMQVISGQFETFTTTRKAARAFVLYPIRHSGVCVLTVQGCVEKNKLTPCELPLKQFVHTIFVVYLVPVSNNTSNVAKTVTNAIHRKHSRCPK